MTEQLFPTPEPERAFARRLDPDTSHTAASRVKVTETQELVLIALRMGGPMTDEQLVDWIHETWPRAKMTEQSIRSRRKELVTKLLAEYTGKKGTTSNGNPTRIWRAVARP